MLFQYLPFLTVMSQAFRPGVVDMTDEQLAVPANAITLQGDGFNLDLFGDTWYGTFNVSVLSLTCLKGL